MSHISNPVLQIDDLMYYVFFQTENLMRSSQSMLYNQIERQASYVAVDEW